MTSTGFPPHLQDLARQVTANTWVSSRKFARTEYFNYLERTAKELRVFCEPGSATPETLVQILAVAVDAEGVFVDHVLSTSTEIKDADTWERMCRAAAWTILQRYDRERQDETWTGVGGP